MAKVVLGDFKTNIPSEPSFTHSTSLPSLCNQPPCLTCV